MTRNTTYTLNALPALIALLLVVLVPRIEHYLAPVVRDFVVVGMQKTPDTITLQGYMRKARDCNFVGVQAVADVGGTQVDVPLIFLDAKNNNATRPQGTQAWGPWRVTVQAANAQAIHLTSTHRCHWIYTTDTHLATIPLLEQ